MKFSDEDDIYTHEFQSWGEFIHHIENTERGEGSGRESDESGSSFSGTESLEEAIGLAKNGWPEGKDHILKGRKELFNGSEMFRKPRYFKSVAGSFPSVPSYIANQPRTMFRRVRAETCQPILEIHVCPNGLGRVDKKSFINYGGYLLNFIEEQENNGRRVEVHITYHNNVSGHGNVTTSMLKKSGEFIDLDFMSFAIAHPSSLRRIEFAMMERSPFEIVRKGTRGGYGSTNHKRPKFMADEAIWLGAVKSCYEDKEECVAQLDDIVYTEFKRIGL